MKQPTLCHVVRHFRHFGAAVAASRKNKMRNSPIRPIRRTCMALLLAVVSVGAMAGQGDGERRGGNRDEAREQRRDERRDRDNDPREYQQAPRQDAQQRRQWQEPQGQPQQSQEGGRRSGRMSVEERRALRRQIDQASHDIYPPGR